MSNPDEKAIERDFCAGVLTLEEVAVKHGITVKALRYLAAKKGWKRAKGARANKGKSGAKKGQKSGAKSSEKLPQKIPQNTDNRPQKKTPKITPESTIAPDEKYALTPDAFGITDQQATFAQLVVEGKSRVDAYKAADYDGEGNTAYVNASRMLRNAKVSRYIYHLRNERQKRYAAELDDVIAQLTAIINADPNEIAQYRRVNCRYCWGEEHKYQWRDFDEQLRAEKQAEADDKPPPDFSGGIGFIDNTDPNPDCPRCNGEGIGEAFFADTRDLVGDARYLFQGVKLGKFGIEINTSDKDGARRELARLLSARKAGGSVSSDRESELSIKRMELQNQKLEAEIERIRTGDKESSLIVVHNALQVPGAVQPTQEDIDEGDE